MILFSHRLKNWFNCSSSGRHAQKPSVVALHKAKVMILKCSGLYGTNTDVCMSGPFLSRSYLSGSFSDTVLPLRKLLWIAHSMEYKHSGCRYPDLSGKRMLASDWSTRDHVITVDQSEAPVSRFYSRPTERKIRTE